MSKMDVRLKNLAYKVRSLVFCPLNGKLKDVFLCELCASVRDPPYPIFNLSAVKKQCYFSSHN